MGLPAPLPFPLVIEMVCDECHSLRPRRFFLYTRACLCMFHSLTCHHTGQCYGWCCHSECWVPPYIHRSRVSVCPDSEFRVAPKIHHFTEMPEHPKIRAFWVEPKMHGFHGCAEMHTICAQVRRCETTVPKIPPHFGGVPKPPFWGAMAGI